MNATVKKKKRKPLTPEERAAREQRRQAELARGSSLTPPEVAVRLHVAVETVRAWITSGELPAANVARRGCRRPRFRVAPEDLATFLAARQPNAPPPTSKPARRRQKETGVIAFY